VSKQILALEDDYDLLRLYNRLLTKAGYLIDSARTLEEARQFLHENDYLVFLCDMHVGSSSSVSLLRQEWAHLKESGTKVIIISGQEQYRTMTADLDIDFFLSKPVSAHDLILYMSRIIGLQSAGMRQG